MEKDKELELEQERELTEEELIELLNSNILLLDTDNVADVELCEDYFKQGVHSVSETCGKLSALMSIGLSSGEALDYILNLANIDYNLKLQSMNNNAQIEISKNQSLQVEKNSI